MMSKSVAVILLGVLCVCCVSGQEECATDVSDCVTVAFDVFTNHAQDIPRVCKATDDFLMCIVQETRTCDPLVAASIKDSMSPMIDIYTAEPYNCKLESADNEAFKPDPCSEQLSFCSIAYYQAQSEATVDYNRACGLFEKYLSCMEVNTTSCDIRTFIKEHTANATREFDKAPLYCEERLQYPLDEVDANMTACDQILQNADLQYAKQDYVCQNYKTYFNCAVQAVVHASPRQFQTYIDGINDVSQSFRTRPYFCESDDPCMELFKACNQSAYTPALAPCRYMDVYRSCLSSANQYCGEAAFITLATTTQILIGDIHNKYNCIEENMDKHFDETTPEAEGHDDNNDVIHDKNEGNIGDTMQNDGPVLDAEDPTPEPEQNSPNNPSKTDAKSEKPSGSNDHNSNSGSDVIPEPSNTDSVAPEPTDGNVIVPVSEDDATTVESPIEEKEKTKTTEKPKGGANSGSNSNNDYTDGGNGSSVSAASLWTLVLTLCVMVVQPRL